MYRNLGPENVLVQKTFGGMKGIDAVNYALTHSTITTKENAEALARKGADAILNSDDPFIFLC